MNTLIACNSTESQADDNYAVTAMDDMKLNYMDGVDVDVIEAEEIEIHGVDHYITSMPMRRRDNARLSDWQ